MKRILFLFACLVAVSTTAKATTTTIEADASITNFVRGYGNSFIFVEAGIEFSVFPDGQFDFYAQAFGPNINFGIQNRNVNFSFNTGFDYNPFVQYDTFGAVIQIENTPVFYDFYGRVSQIGNIFINYNGFGRVNRIGGLNLFWNNNVFLRHTGFINGFNRGYVFRPWHRFYRAPAFNLCVINNRPYRQFYNPVRNVYYRPYRNNARHFNINGRRGNNNFGRRGNDNHYRRYAQTPRNQRERNIGKRVKERHQSIKRSRSNRLASNTNFRRNNVIARNDSRTVRGTNSIGNVSKRNTVKRDNVKRTNRTNSKVVRPQTNRVNRSANTISKRNVTPKRNAVSKRVKRDNNTSFRTSKGSKSRNVAKSRPQVKSRSTVNTKRKSTSVKQKSRTSRSSNTRATKSNSRSRS